MATQKEYWSFTLWSGTTLLLQHTELLFSTCSPSGRLAKRKTTEFYVNSLKNTPDFLSSSLFLSRTLYIILFFLPLTDAHALSHTLKHFIISFLSITHTHTHFLSHTLYYSFSLSLSLSITHTHTHTHTNIYMYTQTLYSLLSLSLTDKLFSLLSLSLSAAHTFFLSYMYILSVCLSSFFSFPRLFRNTQTQNFPFPSLSHPLSLSLNSKSLLFTCKSKQK